MRGQLERSFLVWKQFLQTTDFKGCLAVMLEIELSFTKRRGQIILMWQHSTRTKDNDRAARQNTQVSG